MTAKTDLLTDTDRLSFLDGQRAYIEFRGEPGTPGGYIHFDKDKGWEAWISDNGQWPFYRCHEKDEVCETLRDALDAYAFEIGACERRKASQERFAREVMRERDFLAEGLEIALKKCRLNSAPEGSPTF
jgi:hypothetical protein